MYDDARIYADTADANAAVSGPSRLHGISIYNATSTNSPLVEVHDAATVTGSAKVQVAVNPTYDATHFEVHKYVEFNPPVRFEVGMSVNITGTGAYKLHYSKI